MAPEYYQGFYTVYEELAKHDVPSCIFWTDWSTTLTFSGLLAHQNLFYIEYDNFSAMCKGPANQVPAYCFIEPRYSAADAPTGGVLPQSDQHPDADVRDGETLIRNVYNAIRQNDELWHSSVLVIVYDEHGGIYDHVPPVPLPSPDGLSSVDPPFDFKLSGVRVPAVVISPYIKQGTISKTIFDYCRTKQDRHARLHRLRSRRGKPSQRKNGQRLLIALPSQSRPGHLKRPSPRDPSHNFDSPILSVS